MSLPNGILSSHPLSPVQTGMLFQSLWRPATGFYVQQWQVRFPRRIDPELLRDSWNQLIARHDGLRSFVIFTDQGTPRLHFANRTDVPFQFEDWSGAGAADQKRRLEIFLREDRARPFAFDTAPLMRITLIRRRPRDFHMLWTSHHLLFDGRSRYILLRDLAVIYQALEAGRAPDLTAAPAFRDFLHWIDHEDFSPAAPYWRAALAGVTEPTPIGLGAGVEIQSGSEIRERHVTRFPAPLLRRLEGFAQQHGLTLNTLLQAAWAVVLSRYSRQSDVVFGAPRAGRNCPVPGIAAMVGVFVNTLPVRARVEDTMPVIGFLRDFRENWVAMRPYEQTPLREIHRCCLMPEGQPLFDSLVGFESYQMAERLAADEPWWAGTTMALDGWTNFALTIQAYYGSGLELALTFDPARFSAAAIHRLGGHLGAVLRSFLSPRTRTVGDVSLLTKAERTQILTAGNAPATSYPSKHDVVSIFATVANSMPTATALILEDRHLTYAGLDEASDVVAVRLRARGIGRGHYIGVLLERSFAQIEAILGILKTGAAYVPLDSEYPRERLRFMIADARVSLVLGDDENRGILEGLAVEFATVAQLCREGREAPAGQPLTPDPDAAAYVIYTSGSTGTPKGVVIPHRGILRLVFGIDYVSLGPERTLMQMAPVSFDASTFELWGALLHGARCVLYPSRRPQISELARQIEAHGVDTLWLTTALFNFVIDEAPQILRPVRQLLTGGESLSPSHVAKALENLPDTQLINGYGPTETTTFACCHPIPRTGFDPGHAVPIGRPIGNTTAHVLDGSMRPVPIGVEGELFIGGAGVALGYLHRPELTTERFVRDPFAPASGHRLYRTGDLVCWREDGLLEFRGRIDDQIKIRGFRIEPGEIARALQDHPAVKQAAVVAAEAAGGKELAAFYTTDSEEEVPAASLRSFLSERLPGYMVPARFSAVTEIPRTINGKIDRAALLQGRSAIGGPAGERIEPTTEVGRRLAALWTEILGVKGCAANESFFSMGGDSLSAARLIHRIEQDFGVEIPFRVFFEAPTISRLEQLVRSNDPQAEQPSITTFRRIERGDRWPASEAQTSYVESCFRPENLRRQYIVRAFRMTGTLDVASLVRSIRWVSRQNEALSTRFVIDASGRVFQVRCEGECPVEILELTGLREEQRQPEIHRILLEEQDHQFDPEAPWMHRFRVLEVSPREHILICSFHHANFDGPSLNTFYRELSENYCRFTAGKDAGASAALVQQSEVLDWLQQWMTPERREHSRNFWRTALAGTPLMDLPYAEPAGSDRNEPGRIEYLTVDAATVERLNRQARRHGVSLYQLFLAGFAALINRVGRNDDILVAINVDLRTHGSFAEVIGSFPQRLMIRITLEPDLHFSGVVSRVASRMSEALPHRYLPFDEVRKLCTSDAGQKSPLERVFFVQSTEDAELLALPEVICAPIPRELQRPRGMLSAGMREVSGRVELRAPHLPACVPTETVRSILALFEFIMTTISTGADPRLSELPRLGEPLVSRNTAGAADPHSDLESQILQLVSETLDTTTAGPCDSLFELGGNSLLAAKLIHRIEQSLGLFIPFHALFANPTARSLAAFLAMAGKARTEPTIESFRPGHRGDRWPAPAAQAGHAEFCSRPENLRRQSIVRAFRLTGPLDATCLVRAIQCVSRRHEALSTHFVVEAPGQVSQVRSQGECPVEILGLPGIPEEQRQPEILRLFVEEGERAFDPHAEWMHRFRVLELGPEDHVLICNLHHLNFDGPSLNILYRQLSDAYRTLLSGREPEEPSASIQQSDVLDWLAHWQTAGRSAKSIAYWRRTLADARSVELPIVEPVGNYRDVPGRIEYRLMEPATVEGLARLARTLGVTLYQLFLAGFTAMLNRVGRNDDVLTAINVDVRTHAAFSDTIGYFARRLMIRTTFERDPRFSEIVNRVATSMREALEHRFLPFAEIRKLCGGEAGHRNPLDRVFFVQSPEKDHLLDLPGVGCAKIPRQRQQPLGILSTGMREVSDRVELRASHIPAILPTESVRAMLALFEHIMTAVSTGQDPHLSEFPRLGEPIVLARTAKTSGLRVELERQILQIFREVLGKPETGPFDSFFELGGNSLLAAKLIYRAEQSLGRSIPFHLLFANPTACSLADSLTTPNPVPTEPSIATYRPEVRGERWRLEPARADAVKFTFQPENLRRRNVVRAFRLSGNLDRDALVASIQWVVRRHEALSTHYVVEAGEVHQVRSPGPCPVDIRDLTDLPEDRREAEIRRLHHAEETRAFDPTAEWMHHFQVVIAAPLDHVLLLTLHHANFDGVSLNTFYRDLAEHYRGSVTGEAIDLPGIVPQQTDVHNWLGRWLDPSSRACSRAFWRTTLEGTPSLELPLTAPKASQRDTGHIERISFAAPLVTQLQRRAREYGVTLYQLFLAGLKILLSRVGRNDDIAIGIGIDLRTHGSLADAIGCFVTRITIRTRLDGDPMISDVVRQVASRMQAAMAHRYLPIEEIHELCGSEETFRNIGMVRFTHTGEQDGLTHLADVKCSEIPRGHHQPLGILAIGMREFSGGVELRASHDSTILPTENVRAMLALFDRILTRISLGQNPHLSELPRLGEALAQNERHLALRTNDAAKPPAAPLQTATETLSAPQGPSQANGINVPEARQREIEHSCKPQNRRRRNIVRAFRLQGELHRDHFARAIAWVARRHEALHTCYVRNSSGKFCQAAATAPADISFVDLQTMAEEGRLAAAIRMFAAESDSSFDPAGSLHGFRLLALGPLDYVFIVRFHHLNFDGTSLVTFFRELSAAYGAFVRGREPDFPPPSAQQSDLLDWLERRRTASQSNADREFWRKQLANIPDVRLPLAKDASESLGDAGRIERLNFDAALVQRLEDVARQHGITLYALFLAGLKVLLQRVSGLEDVPVGIAADRRTCAEHQGVMGNFSNMLIVRSDLRGAPSFSTFLHHVSTRIQAALAHRYVSSYELAGLSMVSTDPLTNPLRMVWFIKHPDDSAALELSGLRLTAIPREHFYPAALFSIHMKRLGRRVAVEGIHIPGVLPTTAVKSMFRLYQQIMQLVAAGGDLPLTAFPQWQDADASRHAEEAEGAAARITFPPVGA